uniref:Choline transporter-like protein n=1 Tax=Corethron hystrix TaxID=216773 RepID=A0A7S1BIY0_9STRA|mmetsp:Transcript_28418/g.65009  ORF Transcript_28418/g.65009 Transcript_28418/m.65009 type:complete len:638 (+) Transcript_28418:204-2117(+)
MGKRDTTYSERSFEEADSSSGSSFMVGKSFIGNNEELKRRFTDPLALILLFCVWGVVFWIGSWSLENGNISMLVRGTDYNGRKCGVDFMDDGSLLPPKWYVTDFAGNGKCIETCPRKTILDPISTDDLICKETVDISQIEGCSDDSFQNVNSTAQHLILCGGCMYEMKTYDVMNFCLPSSFHGLFDAINKAANETGYAEIDKSFFSERFIYVGKFARDLMTSWKIIMYAGIGGSTLFGFLYLVLLRLPILSKVTIWTSVVLMPFAFAVGGYMLSELSMRYSLPEFQDEYTKTTLQLMKYSGYLLYIVAFLCLLLLIYLRKRINLAIGITKAAAKSVSEIPSTIIHPFIQVMFFAGFVAAWAYITLLLASTGNPVEKSASAFGHSIAFRIYTFDQNTKYWFWFLLFSLFWTAQFILAIGQITLSICFAKWYFTEDRDYGIETNLWSASLTAIYYHSGTAAFGSILIATTQFIRSVLLYIQTKAKRSGTDNKCIQCVLSCLQCCFCFVEKCLKFINKNAYVHTAIFGHSFCKSGREAFELILHNAIRFTAIGVVQEIAVIFCRLFIVIGTTLGGAYLLNEHKADQLSSLFSMIAVIFVISWFVSSMFIGIFCTAITTVTQCFLVDEEVSYKVKIWTHAI